MCRKGYYQQGRQFIETFKELQSSLLISYLKDLGYTPLHEAASCGYLNVIELLLQHSSDVNCCSKNGSTPLHLAADMHRMDCVMMLLAYGADDSIVNNNRVTPLQAINLKGNDLKKLQNSAGNLLIFCEH